MEDSPVTKWFEDLKRIWLEKDISALKHILADRCEYYEDPFLPALTTWEEIETAWQEVREQDIKELEISVLIDGQTEGSAMYDFVFIDKLGKRYESKGSYYLKLDQTGRAREFRQWWTVQT